MEHPGGGPAGAASSAWGRNACSLRADGMWELFCGRDWS